MAKTNPEVMNSELMREPEEVDWDEARDLAHALFKPSELLDSVRREFVEEVREKTIQAIRTSEDKNIQNPREEPFVYFPSADYSTRLAGQIPDVILMSAFLDFLDSPLADDQHLKAYVGPQRVELDPLSLWRGYLVMTTVGPGQTRLVIDPKDAAKIQIDFDWQVDPTMARDRREQAQIQNLKAEQERFQSILAKHWEALQEDLKLRAQNALKKKDDPLNGISFELVLARAKAR
jgi:hypothetical protein